MNCPRCHQEIEAGAAFCGNCGQALTNVRPAQQLLNVPAYALSQPIEHVGETKALLSLIFGAVGLLASIIPLLGMGIGLAGLVLGTLSHRSHKKTLSTLGIVFSALAIAAALAFWGIAIERSQRTSSKNHLAGSNTAAVMTVSVKTPCYDLSFTHQMNTDYDKSNGCDMRAYEGQTITTSNDVYKVYGNEVATVTSDNFYNVAKTALEKDVSSTLPGFRIDSERTDDFAGSPAYVVNVSDPSNGIAVVETAVLHKTTAGYNVFSLVHATKGSTTDLKGLENQWQWK